jgi:tRNA G18 (ribose-2'-O)-methylase SpoU
MVALLYNVRSLHNVGSIFRTADAAGFEKIYLCGITPTPFDRFGGKRKELVKVALGAEDYLSWKKVGGSPSPQATLALIKRLKKGGFVICAVEQDKKSVSFKKFEPKNEKIALIIGDEVCGIPPLILKAADYILEIPMRGAMVRQAHHPCRTGRGKESLNVSVAFGIIVFHLSGKLLTSS